MKRQGATLVEEGVRRVRERDEALRAARAERDEARDALASPVHTPEIADCELAYIQP